MNLSIIGPSGSGKGTQAKLIAQKYALVHLSMGELMRREIKAQTVLGKKAESYVKKGRWAPLSITLGILKKHIKKGDILLDGFPRRLSQAREYEKYLRENKQKLDAVILLEVTKKEMMARRKKYGDKFQDRSRSDNDPEIFEARWRSYRETIDPIVRYYEKARKLIRIDGNRPVKPIFKDICQALDRLSL